MLTIKNITELKGKIFGKWLIEQVLEEVYMVETDMYLKEPKHYSITFRSSEGRGITMGKFLLSREDDDFSKGKYRYEIYLNNVKINYGSLELDDLRDRNRLISAIVQTFDNKLNSYLP